MRKLTDDTVAPVTLALVGLDCSGKTSLINSLESISEETLMARHKVESDKAPPVTKKVSFKEH